MRPGSLPRLLVCHSRRAGFSDFWPTIGLCTTASLKWSTTAAMANAPPSRSYRLDSAISCLLDGFLEASRRVHRWFIPSVGRHHALPATTPNAPARIPPRRLDRRILLAGRFVTEAGLSLSLEIEPGRCCVVLRPRAQRVPGQASRRVQPASAAGGSPTRTSVLSR